MHFDSAIISAIISAIGSIISGIISGLISKYSGTNQKGKKKKSNRLNTLQAFFSSLAILLLCICVFTLLVPKKNADKDEEIQSTIPTESAVPFLTTTESIIPTETVQEVLIEENYDIPYVLPGTIKKMGHYEQDNKDLNGTEEIEWIALTQEGNEVLIISVLGLESYPYDKGDGPSDWNNCSLRSWLNNTFYQTAFSDEEKENIIEKNIIQHKNVDFPYCEQGDDTIDNVFLLSSEEYIEYMYHNGNIDEENCNGRASTYVAKKEGVDITNGKFCWWWLRTSTRNNEKACRVTAFGVLDTNSQNIHSTKGMVRPAMWVKADWWNELK